MKYLVLAFDAQGRRVLTESADTAQGVAEVKAYARDRGAVQAMVYAQVEVTALAEAPHADH